MSCKKGSPEINVSPWRAKIVVVGDSDSGKSQLCNILHAGYIPQSISTNAVVFGAANYFLDLESSDGWRDAIEFWNYKNQMRSLRCGRTSIQKTKKNGTSATYRSLTRMRSQSRERHISSSTPCFDKKTRQEPFKSGYNQPGFPSSVTLWDTCGEERFRSLMSVYYSNVDIVLSVYREKNGVSARESALGRARDVITECTKDRLNAEGAPIVVLICITDTHENKTAVSDRFHGSGASETKPGDSFQWRPAGETEYLRVDHFIHVSLIADSSIKIREKCILRPLSQISFADDSLHTVDLGSPRSNSDSECGRSSDLGYETRGRKNNCLDTFVRSIKQLYYKIQKCFFGHRARKNDRQRSCSWVP